MGVATSISFVADVGVLMLVVSTGGGVRHLCDLELHLLQLVVDNETNLHTNLQYSYQNSLKRLLWFCETERLQRWSWSFAGWLLASHVVRHADIVDNPQGQSCSYGDGLRSRTGTFCSHSGRRVVTVLRVITSMGEWWRIRGTAVGSTYMHKYVTDVTWPSLNRRPNGLNIHLRGRWPMTDYQLRLLCPSCPVCSVGPEYCCIRLNTLASRH